MDLLDIKISEIKNINLIYLFSTDDIFTDKNNRYLGLKVVYNNQRDYISLDFRDSHFPGLVRKTIERYNQEKDNRNIILLGALTEKLMKNENVLNISERTNDDSSGITLHNTSKDKIKPFLPYLKEILENILKNVLNYETVSITDITGYNHKFLVNYQVGNARLSLPIIISISNETDLSFKIALKDNKIIEGSVSNKLNRVSSSWKSEDLNLNGTLLYDAVNGLVEKKSWNNETTTYYDESSDTIIDEDKKLIDFYFNLFDVEKLSEDFIKTNDYNYIFGKEEKLIEDEENLFIQDSGIQLTILDDRVILRYKVTNGLNKYNNMLNVELDYDLFEITMSKVVDYGDEYLLVEMKTSNNYGEKYNYEVYKISDFDFKNPFGNEYNKIPINKTVKSLYDIKKVLRKEGMK